MDEVLEDDPLLGQVGIVDELADVRPARDELRRLLADDVVRGLVCVQLLELSLELLPFPLSRVRPSFTRSAASAPSFASELTRLLISPLTATRRLRTRPASSLILAASSPSASRACRTICSRACGNVPIRRSSPLTPSSSATAGIRGLEHSARDCW